MEHYIKCARKSLEEELGKKLTAEPPHKEDNELDDLRKELEELRKSTLTEEAKLNTSIKRVKEDAMTLKARIAKIGSDVSTTTRTNLGDTGEISKLRAKLAGIRESHNRILPSTACTDGSSPSPIAQVEKLRQAIRNAVSNAKHEVQNYTSTVTTEEWRVRVQELKDMNSLINTRTADVDCLTRELDNTRLANAALTDELESVQLSRAKMDRELNQRDAILSNKESICKSLKEKVAALEAEVVTLNARKEELLREKALSADKKAALILTSKEVENDVKTMEQELDHHLNELSALRDASSEISNVLSMQNNLSDLVSQVAKARLAQLLQCQLSDSIGHQKATENELASSIARLQEDIEKESKSLNSKNDTAHNLEKCRLTKVEAAQSECESLKAVIFSHEEHHSYAEIKKSQLQSTANEQQADIDKQKEQIKLLEKAIASAKRAAAAKAKRSKDKRKQEAPKRKAANGRQTRASLAREPEVINILDDAIVELNVKEQITSREVTSTSTTEIFETDRDLFLQDSLDQTIQSSDGEDDEEFGSRFGPSKVIKATQSIQQMPPSSQDYEPVDDSLFASDVDSDNDDDFFGKSSQITKTLENTFDADAHRIVASTPILQNRRNKSPEVKKPVIETATRRGATTKSNPVTTQSTRGGRTRSTRKVK